MVGHGVARQLNEAVPLRGSDRAVRGRGSGMLGTRHCHYALPPAAFNGWSFALERQESFAAKSPPLDVWLK
jgi:hypothetical protein